MNLTPRGKSALLRPQYACRSPPSHTLSPKPAVPAEKKGFVYPFSAGKNLWRTARKKTEHRYCRTSWRAMRIFCA